MFIVRMKNNAKQATGIGNNGDPAEIHSNKTKDVCSAILILLSFEKQIGRNIPSHNKFKRFNNKLARTIQAILTLHNS